MSVTMWIKRILAIVFIMSAGLWASEVKIETLQHTDRFVHLKISLAQPQWIEEESGVYAAYRQASFTQDIHQNYVPVIVKFLNLSDSTMPPLTVGSLKTQTTSVERYLHVSGTDENMPRKDSKPWVELKYLGLMGNYPVFALQIFPVRVAADHQTVTLLKSIEVKIGKALGENQNVPLYTKEPATPVSRILKAVALNGGRQLFPLASAANKTLTEDNTRLRQLMRWQSVLQNEIVFKLTVTEDGIYQVTYDDLLKAGFPLNRVDPQNLHLYNKGKEIPIYFKGEQDHAFDLEDYFEFWGESNKRTFQKQFPELYSDPFSDANVYWLVYQDDRGYRLLEESGGINTAANQLVISPFAFRDTLHIERNAVAHKFGHTPELLNRPAYEIDNYYFDGGVSAPGGVGYDFEVPDPADYGAEVVVKAMFRGKSFFDYQTNPLMGHKVTLKLRGKGNVAHLVGTVNPNDGWKDQQSWVITNADSAVKIDQTALNNGTNRLEVDMFQTGVTDIVVLNWFELSYLRKYRAHNDYLKFHVDRDFFDGRFVKLGDRIQFNIDGFSNKDVDVYKIGISKITNVDIKPVTDEETGRFSFGISFQDEVVNPSIKYVALTQDQKKKVDGIEAYRPWKAEDAQASLLNKTNRSNYLIITHDLFIQECQRLREVKTSQGFLPEVVTVRDIYDLFNYGIKSPLAIKEFLRYAYKEWDQSGPLEYVLLVGDASLNYRSSADLVPTIFYNTVKFGAAESDYQYALLEGEDYLPEVIVARLPVSTVYELQNYIDKIEHFPEDPNGRWINQTLFIAGYDGTREYLTNKPVFRAQNLRLINHKLPQALFADQINSIENKAIQPDPHFGSSQDVINAFNRGLSFINFVGHGGGAIWADAGLMGLEDVERLENGYRLPFISSLTCFTASFANAGRHSLGEKLVLSEQKGAIGFLGSSGVGWTYNDFAIAWSLPDFLWDGQFTIGEAIDLMKMFYLASPFYYTEEGRFYTFGYGSLSHSQVSQYNLLGDPSLKIPFAKEKLSLTANPEVLLPGDSLVIKISDFPEPASLFVQVTDEENYPLFKGDYVNASAPFETGFRLPDEIKPQELRVKVFATNQAQSANGFLKLAVNQPLVKKIWTEPSDPTINQPIVFKAILKTDQPIREARIINLFDEMSYENYNVNLPLAAVNDTMFVSQAFSGFGRGGTKIFDVQVTTDEGKTITQHWNKVYVNDPRPDLLVDPASIAWGGQTKLALVFKVLNNSDQPVDRVRVACFDNVVSESEPLAVLEVAFNGKKEMPVEAPLPDNLAYQPYHQIRIVVDVDSVYEERDEQNNDVSVTLFQNYVVISPELGTSLDGENHQKIQLYQNWSFEVAPQTVAAPLLFGFESQQISDLIRQTDQKDLKFVQALNQADTLGLKLSFTLESGANFNGKLAVRLDSIKNGYPRDKISIYRFDPLLNAWSALPGEWSGNELQTTVSAPGIYAPFYTTDESEPLLEISVNGRPLVGHMLIPHRPTLGILLQDVNGVDFNRTLNLKIDDDYVIKNGQLLDKSVTLPDSGREAKNIQIIFNPELAPGEHELFLEVSDVNGNVARAVVPFTVAEGFNLIVYGNYPNPFKDRTIIAYYIESNEEIDDLDIKIYTTSGRLIRSRMLDLDPTILDDNLLEPNYHELIWDGTDDDGNQVANGVYFAVIKAKYRGKTVKHVLKMARLQ